MVCNVGFHDGKHPDYEINARLHVRSARLTVETFCSDDGVFISPLYKAANKSLPPVY